VTAGGELVTETDELVPRRWAVLKAIGLVLVMVAIAVFVVHRGALR
jgi:hypothetical protein